jgi:RHS repeat-associated protein
VAVRDKETDGNGTLDARRFCCHNDLFSVQALVTGGGTVVERYEYDPYGKVTVLDAGGTPKANPDFSEYGSPWTFTGRRLDPETGLLYFRNRYYHPGLGRFVGRDPSGYHGPYNLFAAGFVPNSLDSDGLAEEKAQKKEQAEQRFCCCVDALSFRGPWTQVPMYPEFVPNQPMRFGHRFSLLIQVTYIQERDQKNDPKVCGDCVLVWMEWSDHFPPEHLRLGVVNNRWNNITERIPNSRVFAPWRARKYPIPVPGREDIPLLDIPAFEAPRGTGSRTLHFDISVKGTPGCPCKNAVLRVTASQFLTAKQYRVERWAGGETRNQGGAQLAPQPGP